MKRRYWLLVFAILGLAALAVYTAAGGQTPAGQPPLAGFDQITFTRQFQGALAETRLLALFSPT